MTCTEDIANIIWKVALKWQKAIPENSHLDVEDLVQECWMIEPSTREKFTGEVKYTTFLWQAVNWKCHNILATERIRANASVGCDYEDLPVVIDNVNRPDKQYEVREMLGALSEHAPKGFIEMIEDGVPERLFKMSKRHTRAKRHARGWDALNGKFNLSKSMLENYFNVDLKKLSTSYYNYVESKI